MASPAASPRRFSTTAAMPASVTPCTTLPALHSSLRRSCARTQAAMTSCGSSEPDSRIGTSQEIQAAGAPSAVIIQGSTVLALTSSSPRLVSVCALVILTKLPGSSWQASSEISLQTRASSWSTSAW